MPPERVRRRAARVLERLEREFGRPRRGRERDLVGSLVRTILSQNTSDVNSDRAYAALRERFPGWAEVERARPGSIESAIRVGGLAATKSRRIKRILAGIRRRTGGHNLGLLRSMDTAEVLEYLQSFEGVGPKTAACVALFGLGRDVVPVDTHVHRVVGRLGLVGSPRTPEQTFAALEGVAPAGAALSFHVNLIRLGRSYCRPSRPACFECPLARLCEYAGGREA